MNSTSESNSRAWRLIVGVLPIDELRSITTRSRPAACAYSRARGTVRSLAPSSTRMIWRGRTVWRASDARQWMMLSSSLYAGTTTSTTAVRQSSAGVGMVLSGPRSRPIALSSAFGLSTNQGAVAIFFPRHVAAFCGDQIVDRVFERMTVMEPGQRAQARQVGTTTTDVFEIFAIGFAQRYVRDHRFALRTRDHQLGQVADADLAVVADVGRDRVPTRTSGQRVERNHRVAHVAERAGLQSTAEHGDRLIAHRLRDETRHDHAVTSDLAWTDGVEEARNDR